RPLAGSSQPVSKDTVSIPTIGMPGNSPRRAAPGMVIAGVSAAWEIVTNGTGPGSCMILGNVSPRPTGRSSVPMTARLAGELTVVGVRLLDRRAGQKQVSSEVPGELCCSPKQLVGNTG